MRFINNRTEPLLTIVLSQFLCTSLWFAGNAVMPDLVISFNVGPDFVAHLTSAVQLGFIAGTLIFALLMVSDRFSPSLVFFCSAIIASFFNIAMCMEGINATTLLALRFMTGFFLAGIYPVGMKIASDYYREGLGKSLGLLVGALVVGTALPHLLKSLATELPWKSVLYVTSGLSVLGGLAMLLLVPDGPHRSRNDKPDIRAFISSFKNKDFRSAAFGYFGHMWELYAFWAFVPLMVTTYNNQSHADKLDVSLTSFVIIAAGGVACVLGGFVSQRFGVKRVATFALLCSCLCCLLSPLLLFSNVASVFVAFMIFWGMMVVADSPLFSTLVAHNATDKVRGTSLTFVNCIGFSITIVSIQFLHLVSGFIDTHYIYTLLSIGPVLGLVALTRNGKI